MCGDGNVHTMTLTAQTYEVKAERASIVAFVQSCVAFASLVLSNQKMKPPEQTERYIRTCKRTIVSFVFVVVVVPHFFLSARVNETDNNEREGGEDRTRTDKKSVTVDGQKESPHATERNSFETETRLKTRIARVPFWVVDTTIDLTP